MSKYYYNKDFFQKIDTEEKAYWLGFLYADGCINRIYKNEKLKSMNLEIGLCRDDEDHLRKFISAIESNIDIKRRTNKLNGKNYESSRLTVCCTKMCRDLISCGCTPEKSLILKFPSTKILPDELVKHFIRGYFDGDGCVCVNKNRIIQINFVGTKDFLNGVVNYLLINKIIYKHPSIYQKGNAFEIYIYGADIIEQFYHHLYDNSKVYLDRKFKKFLDFYNIYNDIRKSKSGKQGVRLSPNKKRWCVTGYTNGQQKYLGSYKNKSEAINVRKNFEIAKYAD